MSNKTEWLSLKIRNIVILGSVLCLSACGSSSSSADGSTDELNDLPGTNQAPIIGADIPRVAEQGRPFVAVIEATDVDDEVLTFSGSGLPSWLSLNSLTGRLTGVPQQSYRGHRCQ